MVEYTKMKNADLEGLLKTRGLPTGGKKADMVERLTNDDEEKKAAGAPAAAAKAPALDAEDEIDWDDDVDETPATAAKPATSTATESAATAATKAGGEGPVGNPQAVPNQKADIDPSKTDDLAVKSPAEGEEVGEGAKAEQKREPTPVDYSKGLAATDLDQEIERRKARAKKFGLKIEDDEGLKKLERMKKFGETGPPKGLDEALPERSKKRGREAGEDDRGENKRRGGGRHGARRGGRGNRDGGDRRRDDRDDRRDNRKDNKSRPANGGSWMTDADKQKADARKNRFAAPAA
ncbi:hypothetical protein BDV96DRAFT_220636 [Lophiotrema nucula]|uniref:SAP domain-containing protein n=1 Tax=Lophiotrema nucula TaxID=690887 RepID=A0A6A5YSI2_9PLEO|nr:hypothetical protein BDV96DRAFT_220636 [Lophiotrema nucula]